MPRLVTTVRVTAATSTGRQRREGSRPSGNSSGSTRANSRKAGAHVQPASQTAALSPPRAASAQDRLYVAAEAPMTRSSSPTVRAAACRTSSAPTTAAAGATLTSGVVSSSTRSASGVLRWTASAAALPRTAPTATSRATQEAALLAVVPDVDMADGRR
jgi:hypothetical protein